MSLLFNHEKTLCLKRSVLFTIIAITSPVSLITAGQNLHDFITQINENVSQKETSFKSTLGAQSTIMDLHKAFKQNLTTCTDYAPHKLYLSRAVALISNIQRLAVYDVGSTGTRVSTIDIDPHNPKNFEIIDRATIATDFNINLNNCVVRILLYNEIKACVDSLYGQKPPPIALRSHYCWVSQCRRIRSSDC